MMYPLKGQWMFKAEEPLLRGRRTIASGTKDHCFEL